MNTNTKIKRIQRRRKLRRQRSTFFMIMMLLAVMMAHGAFSKSENSSKEYNVLSVTVEGGDTLWDIAKEYKPEGKDLREYVYEIASNNGLEDCAIYGGQTIFVPVMYN